MFSGTFMHFRILLYIKVSKAIIACKKFFTVNWIIFFRYKMTQKCLFQYRKFLMQNLNCCTKMTVFNLLTICSIVLQLNTVTVLCQTTSDQPGNSSKHDNITSSTTTISTTIDNEESSGNTAMAIVVIVLAVLLLITGCIAAYYCFLEDHIKKYRNGKRKGSTSSRNRNMKRSKSKALSQKYQSKRMVSRRNPSFVSKKRSNRSMKRSKRYLSQGIRKPVPSFSKEPMKISISHNSLNESAAIEAKSSFKEPIVKIVKSPELQLKRIPTKKGCTLEKKTKLQIAIENACKNVYVKPKDSNHDLEASKKKSRKASKKRSTQKGKTSKKAPKANINTNSKLW